MLTLVGGVITFDRMYDLPRNRGTVSLSRTSRPRRYQLHLALLASAVALAVPSVALAWSSYYSWEEARNAGSIRYSGANYNLNYHVMTFAPYVGTNDKMQMTLCDSSYACYPYTECPSSCAEYRSI